MNLDKLAEIVDVLTELRHRMYSNSVQNHVLNNFDEHQKAEFAKCRRKLNLVTTRMQNIELTALSNLLRQNEKELNTGITSLKDALASIEKVLAAIQTITRVVSIIGRGIGLFV